MDFRIILFICLLVLILIVGTIFFFIISKKKIQINIIQDITVEELTELKKKYNLGLSKNSKPYSSVYINIDISYIEKNYDEALTFSTYRQILEIILKNLHSMSNIKLSHMDDRDFVCLTHSTENSFINFSENVYSDIRDLTKRLNIPKFDFIHMGMYFQKDITVSFEAAVENAKCVCMDSKTNGKKFGVASYDILEKLIDNKKFDINIIKAVEHKEFSVKLYPYIENETGKIFAYQAHKRLMRPLDRLVIPDTVYKVIDDNNLEMQFEYSIFNNVCEIVKAINHEEISDTVIACSFSQKTLSYFAFPQHIKLIADNYKIDYTKMAIIASENIFNAEKATIISNLKSLQKLGFKIFINQYDASYISYYDLQNFLVDMIIIDKEILYNEETNTGKNALESIKEISNSLNIPTTFDGLTKKEQQDIAKKYACKYVKGIIYNPDIKINEIEKKINYM